MNKKKASSNTTKKVVKKNTTKKVTPKTETKKKKKKGAFTLIELLAVIIILGVIMIIAIPSVTKYISNTRKNAYIDTAKNLVGSARTLVNSGDLEMYDQNATYYIPVTCLKTENSSRSPYGDFTEAYVVVTYDRQGYDYYWTSTDTSQTGIKTLVAYNDLDIKKIEAGVKDTDIRKDIGIDNRENVILYNEDCSGKEMNEAAVNYNTETGTVGEKQYTFTLNGETYQYSNGMTWGEWINSEYNTIDAKYQEALDIIYTRRSAYACNSSLRLDNYDAIINNNTFVKSTDIINGNISYGKEWDSCMFRYSTSTYGTCYIGFGEC